jgi:NADH-quinone oxidoreductase subunit J
MVSSILFYIIAAFIIFAALKMVLSKNLVHSSLFMAAAFMGIAMVYLLLDADYIAAVQVMVYVGAISILFVFGVMLTRRGDMGETNGFNRYKIYGAITAIALFLVLSGIIIFADFVPAKAVAIESTVKAISSLLLNDYSIALEVSSILLLVATVGAIVIGKGVKRSK